MNKLYIYTDGGARGNPGPAGIGIVISEKKLEEKKPFNYSMNSEQAKFGEARMIKKYSEYIGEATNNEAEYQALIFALRKAKGIFKKADLAGKGQAECFLDSELVVRQLNHQYKIKDKSLIELFIKVWNLMLDFSKVTFKYIPREKNREADRLVNKALNAKEKRRSLPGI